ncbi:hypothetical protein [Sorangium sp. So ce1151]|uniref:hypothetical protein n=1 Tax=Sorangium sp. So ce1151 TaxID=3133332 RepID=UPI003F60FAC8
MRLLPGEAEDDRYASHAFASSPVFEERLRKLLYVEHRQSSVPEPQLVMVILSHVFWAMTSSSREERDMVLLETAGLVAKSSLSLDQLLAKNRAEDLRKSISSLGGEIASTFDTCFAMLYSYEINYDLIVQQRAFEAMYEKHAALRSPVYRSRPEPIQLERAVSGPHEASAGEELEGPDQGQSDVDEDDSVWLATASTWSDTTARLAALEEKLQALNSALLQDPKA